MTQDIPQEVQAILDDFDPAASQCILGLSLHAATIGNEFFNSQLLAVFKSDVGIINILAFRAVLRVSWNGGFSH